MRHSFLDEHAHLESPVHRLDARAKIVTCFGLVVVCVSTPPECAAAFAGYALFLALLLGASRVPVRYVARRALVVLPFVALAAIFIPFFRPDPASGSHTIGLGAVQLSRPGLLIFWNVLIKAALAVAAMTLLSSTTPFPQLMRGLEQLKAPRLLVMLASFAYRYLFVLIDEAERMERARDARGYRGRWLWQAHVIGQMIGMLFLRSYERAERVYAAMLSRGFDGHALGGEPAPLRAGDGLFTAAALALLLLFRVTGPWMQTLR